MKISILVQSNPISGNTQSLALQFAQEAIRQGHSLHRIFFYKDGGLIGNDYSASPNDEISPREKWGAFAKDTGTELAICIAAAGRRGVIQSQNVAEGFSIVGLGQMVEAMFESDRTVTF